MISATDVPAEWAGRAIRCRRLDMLPVECIARGYLAGLGLESYNETGTISGVRLPRSSEGSKLPEPVFTPTTKAAVGHDESDRPPTRSRRRSAPPRPRAEAAHPGGLPARRRDRRRPRDHHRRHQAGVRPRPRRHHRPGRRGAHPGLSRFWSASEWQPGRPQRSLDKQFVRDWSSSLRLGPQPPGRSPRTSSTPPAPATSRSSSASPVRERGRGAAMAGPSLPHPAPSPEPARTRAKGGGGSSRDG